MDNFEDLLEFLYVNELVDECLNLIEENEEVEEQKEPSKILIKEQK